jgi:glycosyltransferase involved in cell wall biosynthesis
MPAPTNQFPRTEIALLLHLRLQPCQTISPMSPQSYNLTVVTWSVLMFKDASRAVGRFCRRTCRIVEQRRRLVDELNDRRSGMVANRIALAINGRFLARPISGVERYARELIQALDGVLMRAKCSAFRSVTIWVPPSVPADALPSGLQFVRIERAGRLAGHPWEQLELPRIARDAVLISLTNSAPLLHPRQVVAIHDAAIVQYPGDFKWSYRAWYRGLYAGLRRTPARFISVSSFAAREVARHFRIAGDRITVIHNAAEHFHSLKPDRSVLDRLRLRERGYILAVGGRSRRKNLTVIERALAGFDACPTLVVAGGGTSRAFAASNAAPASNSIFLDHVSDAAIKGLYEGALCLVFPSRYEGFGLPPLEAMACGCPVIASHAASMPEVCGDAALYCDPDRPDTIAANIRLLMTDPAQRNKLIASGTDRARLFSWERSASKLLEVAERQAEQ